MSKTLLLVQFCMLGFPVFGADWDYYHQDLWPAKCNKGPQSPISVDKKIATASEHFNLTFSPSYMKLYDGTVINTGKTIQVDVKSTAFITLTYKNALKFKVNKDYVFSKMVFHWPAEHIIDGKSSRLELHLEHFQQKFKTYEKAARRKDGLLKLAIFFKLSNKPNSNFDSIIKAISSIASRPSASIAAKNINLYEFIPKDRSFYYYEGSETAPSCRTNSQWVLLTQESTISGDQLQNLTKIQSSRGLPVMFNNRDLQPVKLRKIVYKQYGKGQGLVSKTTSDLFNFVLRNILYNL